MSQGASELWMRALEGGGIPISVEERSFFNHLFYRFILVSSWDVVKDSKKKKSKMEMALTLGGFNQLPPKEKVPWEYESHKLSPVACI